VEIISPCITSAVRRKKWETIVSNYTIHTLQHLVLFSCMACPVYDICPNCYDFVVKTYEVCLEVAVPFLLSNAVTVGGNIQLNKCYEATTKLVPKAI
jgi:hypothetical protein